MFHKATLRPSREGRRSRGLQRWLKPLRCCEGVREVGGELGIDLPLLVFGEAAVHGGVGPLKFGGRVSMGADEQTNQSVPTISRVTKCPVRAEVGVGYGVRRDIGEAFDLNFCANSSPTT